MNVHFSRARSARMLLIVVAVASACPRGVVPDAVAAVAER